MSVTTPSPVKSSQTLRNSSHRSSSISSSRSARTPTPVPNSQQKTLKVNKAPSLRRPQKVVTLHIAPDPDTETETFIIHKDILCHYSSYFAAAFNSPAHIETQTQSMTFKDISPDDFGLLVHWLYTQSLDLCTTSPTSVIPLTMLWTLGSRFKIASLQNTIMTFLRPLLDHTESKTLVKFFEFAYEDASECVMSEREILRELAAERMALGTTSEAMEKWMGKGLIGEKMMRDMILCLKREHVPGCVVKRMDICVFMVCVKEEKED